MQDFNETQMFAGLPAEKNRWRSLACGYASQAVITGIAFFVMLSASAVVERRHYENISLVAPQAEPVPVAQARPKLKLSPIEPVRISRPTLPETVQAPVLPRQEIAKLHISTAAPTPVLVAETNKFNQVEAPRQEVRKPEQVVQTNNFGGTEAQTAGKMNPQRVQTGGFGDPNSPSNAVAGARANVAAVGSFDMGVGEGHGNGTGGRKGAVGAVAAAGFGASTGTSEKTRRTERVQLASFNEVTQAASTAPRQVAQQDPATTPAEIKSKPWPVYTAEARKLGVEGDVVLQVILSADGKVRVTRVVRGLGHGLDEAATRAAEGVVFKPAQRDGHPVDSLATLHIVFQLS